MAYCYRCGRTFKNKDALNQHIVDSDKHNVCAHCHMDFFTSWDLAQHWRDVGPHAHCEIYREVRPFSPCLILAQDGRPSLVSGVHFET